jgi:hypothetical protein
MGDKRVVRRILAGRSKGEKLLGRPGSRWEKNIEEGR